MTDPTPLSPAAQAVLDAAFSELPDGLCLKAALAAAIRAAADQVVPEFWHEDNDIYGETIQDVREKFLAIAAQLEA